MNDKTNYEVNCPSSKADRNHVRAQMGEGVNCLIRIEDQRQALKDIIDAIHEKHNMPKKTIRKLIMARYKRNKDEIIAETNEFEDAYESLFEESSDSTDPSDVDDWKEDAEDDGSSNNKPDDLLSVGSDDD